MKKSIITFVLVQAIVINIAQAQDNFAVIKDKDEFTNVREGNPQSKIIGKISKYQPFDCMESEDVGAKAISNMVYIDYYEYTTKQGCVYLQNEIYKTKQGWYDTPSKSGYIHKSRVQKLVDLPVLTKILDTQNKAIFKNDTITVTFEFEKFDSRKHSLKNPEGKTITQSQIAQSNTSYFVATIDNEKIWGTDGGIPSTEIKSITIICKDKSLSLPANSLKNIFEPSIHYAKICVGPDGELYIWMNNSDGAGVYNVIWVIVDGELKYRFTRISFYV